MPTFDVSELNTIIAIFGAFTVLYGIISVKIKDAWFLGEALPAVLLGIGVMRVMIGIQLVMAGYQLPAKYQQTRWKDMIVLMLPVMTVMWLATTVCVLVTIPKLSLLAAMVIASCVTSTDPVLSQAVAKGPFSDNVPSSPVNVGVLFRRAGEVGRQGGGVGVAIGNWFLETWLYFIILSIIYGAAIGWGARIALKFSMKRKWIDSESYVLAPTALGLFLLGTSGCLGIDDLLACFVAGSALNWDGEYLAELIRRHDEVNASRLPWREFQSDVTGITYGRLVGLGVLVLLFRRIPAVLMTYRLMPNTIANWREALFMGYFGPIGVGAAFYVEHARHLFPKLEEATNDEEVTNLLRAMGPVVYWLALFSIVIHGISIPILNAIYEYNGVKPIKDDAVQMRRKSRLISLPVNAEAANRDTIIAYNRFSRPVFDIQDLPFVESNIEPPMGGKRNTTIRFEKGDDLEGGKF
ncbi:unnamed protein product [Parascedosporium putredinis]|uniref:Cation/H+ exchanger transmembrane domain-containing protein n=1 Tax=Parascedosporium putredinis TaxID=1442378 RepID=A0A9P1M8H7_9PEZI|nr:unnamed protein product [Parascedosporium putredinis]CAI7990166.1 unnamed protein product [Parascedosporium putredinis]